MEPSLSVVAVRRVVVVLLGMTLLAGLVPTSAGASFVDTPPGAYFAEAVAWAHARGITTGVGGSNRFEPDRSVQRAEAITFLWRAAGSRPAPASGMADVPRGAYFAGAVDWAVARRITTGAGGSNRFEPQRAITRAEAVAFLWRRAGSPAAKRTRFVDLGRYPWAVTAVAWAEASGITTGVGGSNRFEPGRHVTRGEYVTMMWRAFGSPSTTQAAAGRPPSRPSRPRTTTTTTTTAPTTTTTKAPTTTTTAPTTTTTKAPTTTTTTAPAPAHVLHVSPSGTGDCTAARPCGSVDAAYARATSGTVIRMASGSYPSQRVSTGRARAATWTSNVVVEPAPGASVTVRGFEIAVDRLTIRGVTVTGRIYMLPADRVSDLRLERLDVRNASIFLNGVRRAALVDSVIRDGVNKDGLNVKDGAVDVVVSGNIFRDMRHDPNAGGASIHVDCIQTFGVTRLAIVDNWFDNCSQRALILQAAGRIDTVDVEVRDNHFGGCNPLDNVCQTRWVPFQATGELTARRQDASSTAIGRNYTVTNNTIDGYAYLEALPGLRFDYNRIGRFFHEVAGLEICGTEYERYNVVRDLGRCATIHPTSTRS